MKTEIGSGNPRRSKGGRKFENARVGEFRVPFRYGRRGIRRKGECEEQCRAFNLKISPNEGNTFSKLSTSDAAVSNSQKADQRRPHSAQLRFTMAVQNLLIWKIS
jgi:hypothetical protein